MSRFFIPAVGALGLVGSIWAARVAPSDPVAVAMLALIAVGLVAGVVELFVRTRSLDALQAALPRLEGSTEELNAYLQDSTGPLVTLVRARLRGEPATLPRAELLPYLTGALIVLGMLGTFVGLAGALGGAELLLTSADSTEALKNALMAPLGGIRIAFSTTVAGVAGSTSLGVASVILRRQERRIEDVVERAFEGSLARLTPQGRQVQALERLAGDESPLLKAATTLETVLENLPRLDEGMSERQKALATTLEASVAESTQKMSASVAESLQGTSAVHREALEGALSSFGERIAAMQLAQDSAAARTAETLAAFEQALSAQLSRAADLDEQLKRAQEAAATKVAAEATAAVASLSQASEARTEALLARLEERWAAHDEERQRSFSTLTERAGQDREAAQAALAEVAQKTVELAAAHEQRMAELDGRLASARAEAEQASTQKVAETVERMEAGLQERAKELLALGTQQDERSAKLVGDLRLLFDGHAADMSGALAQTAKTVRHGADALEAGGVELEALADRLTETIDAHRDAARAFTERLASLEGLLRELTKSEEEERLSDYLDQTREAFDRSTEASRELVGVLQSLKSQTVVPTAAGEPLEGVGNDEEPGQVDA